MSDLFVIEAFGKTGKLSDSLRRLGIRDARIEATGGHLFALPARLSELGIDSAFRETRRGFRCMETGERITRAVLGCDRLFIATDPDQEGDVIAHDVHMVALMSGFDGEIWRLRPAGLDHSNIRAALLDKQQPALTEHSPGRARAIIDRMVGHSFSGNGVAAGRILSPMLATSLNADPVLAEAVFRLKAQEGDDFVACIPVRRSRLKETESLLAEFQGATRGLQVRTGNTSIDTASLPTMLDILLNAAAKIGLQVDETARMMQKLYMRGRLSYPRSTGRHVNPQGLAVTAQIARQSGIRFDKDAAVRTPDGAAHESPHVIDPTVTINGRLAEMEPEEALLVMIARMTISGGQRKADCRPAMQDVPAAFQALGFTRPSGWRMPEEASTRQTGLYMLSKDVAILRMMTEQDLGRPSTWPGHVAGMIERNLLDDLLLPTDKGLEWLAATPDRLKDPRIARRIETLIEKPVLSGDRALPAEAAPAIAMQACGIYGEDLLRRMVRAAELDMDRESPVAPGIAA